MTEAQMKRNQSSALMQRACLSIPGGVNSPVRAFKGVGGDPVFFERADGAFIFDVDGNQYVDYIGSWGPMVLGHNHPPTIAAFDQCCDLVCRNILSTASLCLPLDSRRSNQQRPLCDDGDQALSSHHESIDDHHIDLGNMDVGTKLVRIFQSGLDLD